MDKLETLDKHFRNRCVPNYKEYTFIDKDKTIIHNFFKYFKQSQNFLKSRDKWETNIFDGNLKPGVESIFPNWFVPVFLEKYFIDNKIKEDANSSKSSLIYLYNGIRKYNNLSSESIFPHIDNVKSDDGFLNYVCLVNLNNFPVTTVFWKYKNKSYCENQIDNTEYVNYVIDKSKIYYQLNDLERKKFINTVKELEIVEEITYCPNEALVYPLNLYHSPKIENIHTKHNPRVLLRLTFDALLNAKDF